MPVHAQQSRFLSKFGAQLTQAHQEHSGRTPDSGNPQLPAGIENGIAKVVDLRLGEFKEGKNKGESFFMGAAIVVEPQQVKDSSGRIVKVANLRTTIGPEPLCNTPSGSGKRKTFSDHYGWMRDQLLILGFDIDQLPATDPNLFEQNLVAGMAALITSGVYTRFRTWKGSKQGLVQRQGGWWCVTYKDDEVTEVGTPKGPYPTKEAAMLDNPYADSDPRVVHEWNGAVEYTATEVDPANFTEDSTAPPSVPPSVGNPPANRMTLAPVASGGNPIADQLPSSNGAALEPDLKRIAAQAVDSAEAQSVLTEMALALGITQQEVDDAQSWFDVVASMQARANSQPEANPEETGIGEEWSPRVKEIYYYNPIDPKTKKPALNPKTKKPVKVEVEITGVDEANRTVALKNLDNPKVTYSKVSWDALVGE